MSDKHSISGNGFPFAVEKNGFTRRNAVAFLGLAAAASSAATVEALGTETNEGMKGFRFGNKVKGEHIAIALEKLAADIRQGNTFIMGSTLLTKVDPEEFVTHKFEIEFALRDLPEA